MYQTLIKPLFADIKNFILDTLFPIRCLVCEKEDKNFICDGCKPRLKRLQHQHCAICQKPSIGGLTHPNCQSPQAPEGLLSLLDYKDEKTADILIKGKYQFVYDVYKTLGQMLGDFLKTDHAPLLAATDALVPLPLHQRRLRWRGFNQAAILCQTLSEQLGLPVVDALQRTKATKTQKDLKKEQRLQNVESAFTLASHFSPPQAWGGWPKAGRSGFPQKSQSDFRGAPRGRTIENYDYDIKGKNLILIDDVTTTGSTLLEAVKVLKRNGAKAVWCLTVARD
jgi:ComF family protein